MYLAAHFHFRDKTNKRALWLFMVFIYLHAVNTDVEG